MTRKLSDGALSAVCHLSGFLLSADCHHYLIFSALLSFSSYLLCPGAVRLATIICVPLTLFSVRVMRRALPRASRRSAAVEGIARADERSGAVRQRCGHGRVPGTPYQWTWEVFACRSRIWLLKFRYVLIWTMKPRSLKGGCNDK